MKHFLEMFLKISKQITKVKFFQSQVMFSNKELRLTLSTAAEKKQPGTRTTRLKRNYGLENPRALIGTSTRKVSRMSNHQSIFIFFPNWSAGSACLKVWAVKAMMTKCNAQLTWAQGDTCTVTSQTGVVAFMLHRQCFALSLDEASQGCRI